MNNVKKWMIFISCAIAVFMVDVDLTAVNLILSNIASDMRVSITTMQWIIDGYMIAAAALMAFGGRLSDSIGARRVFLCGIIAFALSSAAVGYSNGATEMIVARIIQGACIAFTFPISLVVIRYAFPENQQGFVVGLMVAIAGLSQAIGPTFGGWILTYFGWRTLFLINIPLSAITLLIGYFTIHKHPINKASIKSLQLPAVSLFCFALLLLMYALNEASHWGIISVRFISALVISIASLIYFSHIEKKSDMPILNLKLFKIANFSTINVTRFILSFTYFTLLFTVSLLLINVLGYTTMDAGFFLLLLTLVVGVLSIPAGKLIDKVGVKKPLLIGMTFLLLGFATLCSMYINQSTTQLVISLLFLGVSFALTTPASATATMMSVPREQGGSALGLFFTTSFIGGSVGIAISSLILHTFSSLKLTQLLKSSPYVLNTTQTNNLYSAAGGALSINYSNLNPHIASTLRYMAHSAFIYGFFIVTCVSLSLTIIALFCTNRLNFKVD